MVAALFLLLQVPGYAVLAFRLFRTGLSGVYRYLTVFVIFDLLRVGIASSLRSATDLYAHFYLFTQPFVWLFYALMTLEVYQNAFRSQAGIARFSGRVISCAVAVSTAIAVASLFLSSHSESVFENYLALERAINFSLLCFVLVLIAFLSWFPVPLARNALVHSWVFSLFFGVKAVSMLIRTLAGPEVNAATNVAVLVTSVFSLALWAILLTAAGERVQVRAGYRRSGIDQDRLMNQLELINRTLLRSAKD
jgi:hypothetical protein